MYFLFLLYKIHDNSVSNNFSNLDPESVLHFGLYEDLGPDFDLKNIHSVVSAYWNQRRIRSIWGGGGAVLEF